LEHSKFDISNSSLPMLLIRRFERHVLDFITQSGGTVERPIYRDSVRIQSLMKGPRNSC